ncbi:MAG: hypothetical protein U9O20_02290 [Patescibacteria group bacterium]|nr:hypothetical protein [Patescibacteria group bacterium]
MASQLKKDLKTIGTARAHSRTREQHTTMKKAIKTGNCPFCLPQIENWKYPAIKEGGYWIFKPNDFPYEDHRHHFVIIFKPHTNDVLDVPEEAWVEFGEIFDWVISKYKIIDGAFVMRFGLSKFNASTVRHLHAHIQVPTNSALPEKSSDDRKEISAWLYGKLTDTGFPHNCWHTLERVCLLPHYRNHYLVYYNGNKKITSPDRKEWPHLFTTIQKVIKKNDLPGGGITIPFGPKIYNHRFLNKTAYAEIHVPNGTGKVWAVFVPNKYRCKATFAKDTERDGLRKKRQKEFEK